MIPRVVTCLLSVWLLGHAFAFPSGIYLQKTREFHTSEEFQRLTSGRVRFFRQPLFKTAEGNTLLGSRYGIVLCRGDGTLEPYPPDRLLPNLEITVLAEERPGVLWIGTRRGAVRYERNPLWNFIYAAGTGSKNFDAEESLQTLRLIPMDLVSWSVMNSHRLDITVDPMADRFKTMQSLVALPPDERPIMKWNGNPYSLDGGDGGRSEDDGAFFLLPYWLGRFHHLIE